MRKIRYIVIFMAFLIFWLCSVSVQGKGNPNEVDSEGFLSALKASLENNHKTVCGKGNSKVLDTMLNEKEELKKEEYSVSFMFKGNNSRSDFFESNNENKSVLDRIWFMNEEKSGLYSNKSVLMQQDSFDYFERNYGMDYHPDTFMTVSGIPFTDWIDSVMKNVKNTSVLIDENGIAKITLDFKKEDVSYLHEVFVNTQKGFCIESWLCEVKGKDSLASWKAEYKWSTFNDYQYVREIDYEEKEIQQGVNTILHKRNIIVEDMSIVDDIDDIMFTAGGLQLPDSTPVTDKTLGVVYRLGSPGIVEEDLFETLKESNKYQDIQKSMTNPDNQKTITKLEQKNETFENDSESNIDKSSDRNQVFVFPILIGVIIIVACIFTVICMFKRKK